MSSPGILAPPSAGSPSPAILPGTAGSVARPAPLALPSPADGI